VLLGVLIAEYTPYVHTEFVLIVRAGYAGSQVHSVHMLVQGAASAMRIKVFLRHMAQLMAHGTTRFTWCCARCSPHAPYKFRERARPQGGDKVVTRAPTSAVRAQPAASSSASGILLKILQVLGGDSSSCSGQPRLPAYSCRPGSWLCVCAWCMLAYRALAHCCRC